MTVHPALHNSLMPMRDAIVSLGTMWTVKIVGRPGIVISQTWVDMTLDPSGKFMVRGFVAIRLLSTGVPSMMNMAVAPVSAMA